MPPYPGAVIDLPYGMAERMILALNVFSAVKSAASANDLGVWSEQNPDAAETYTMVRKMQSDNAN